MASKTQTRNMEMEFQKFLFRHPEIIERFKTAKVMHDFECAFIFAADYMNRFLNADKDEINKFLAFCDLQFETINEQQFDNFFQSYNDVLKEEIGVDILGRYSKKGDVE